MATSWKKVYLRVLEFLISWQRFFVHLFLSIAYIGRKKAVPPSKDPILLLSATQLAEQIREGKVLSETAVLSYIKRIREVQPLINAMVEDRFGDALDEAKQVDLLISMTEKSKEEIAKETPLLGVPVSVKLMISVKGMVANGASKSFEYRKAEEDAHVVSLMKKAGAIIIATTNIPEFAAHIETSNALYGRTNNPYDLRCTVGGSSGGEAALVASAGSVLGLGTDLGGGLRLPASFCALFTHKPTSGIVIADGMFPEISPLCEEFLGIGPMCRYSEDLLTAMKVLAEEQRTELQLDEPVDLSKLKVYYTQSDGDNLLTPPVDENILLYQLKACFHLQNLSGTEAENIEIKSMQYAFTCWLNKITLSRTEFEQDPITKQLQVTGRFLEILKCWIGKANLGFFPSCSFMLDGVTLTKALMSVPLVEKHLSILEETMSSVLDENSILLVPAFPFTSCYHGEASFLLQSIGLMAIFNLLGLPVTQCPISFTPGKAPMSVQLVAAKGNDRLAIACAKELEKAFGGWRMPSVKR